MIAAAHIVHKPQAQTDTADQGSKGAANRKEAPEGGSQTGTGTREGFLIPIVIVLKNPAPKGRDMAYDFRIAATDTATMYRDLAAALEALVEGETDPIANMANSAALIWETLPELNWAGFYRNVGGELVVGPFQGRPACIRINSGRASAAVSQTRQGATCR